MIPHFSPADFGLFFGITDPDAQLHGILMVRIVCLQDLNEL
jgi:hypothetical protein